MPETRAAPAAIAFWRDPFAAVLVMATASIVGAVVGAWTYTKVDAPYWDARSQAVLPLCGLAVLTLGVYLAGRPRIRPRLQPLAATTVTVAWVAVFVGALNPADLLGPPEIRPQLASDSLYWVVLAQYWGLPDPNNKDWTQPLDYQVDYVRIWKYQG